jgi:S1-C subfamily serine protease
MKMIVITSLCLLVLFPTRGISQANNGVPVADAQQIERLVARVDPATVKIEVKRIEIESSEDNSDQAGYLEFVLAFGSPFGLGHSVSFGIVSSPLRETDYGPYRYIQTDAPVNPGNSGGPLVDLRGNLVGINTLIYSFSGGSEGVGFALPLATVRRAVESIQRFGYARRSDFGLCLAPISESIARGLHLPRTGMLVEDVDLGRPAAITGIRSGDVLLSVNGVPVSSFEDLDVATYALRPMVNR